MVQAGGQKVLLMFQTVKMSWFEGRLQVTAPVEVTVNVTLLHELFHAVN